MYNLRRHTAGQSYTCMNVVMPVCFDELNLPAFFSITPNFSFLTLAHLQLFIKKKQPG